jgi:biopolymer transport protein ExbD
LIDVVFLLKIIYLTVSHISQVKVEPLPLPEAEEGKKPQEQNSGRLIINVHKDGRVSGSIKSVDSLQQVLMNEIERSGRENLSILLRGDRSTDWANVSRIMQICTSNGIGRINVAVTEPGGTS